jgi:hypothetical protein
MDEALNQLRTELAEMRATMERQQSRIAELESAVPAPTGGGKLRSRRQVLKLAGATIAGAAAGIAGSAVPALAASGGPMVLGGSSNTGSANAFNAADAATELRYTGTASPGVGFVSQVGASFQPTAAVYPSALAGWSMLANTPNGVYGWTSIANGRGVVGSTEGAGGVGVFGTSFLGYGGQFAMATSSAKAQLLLLPSASAGAPAPAGHTNGELYVDSAGVLYYFSGGSFNPLAGGAGGITTMLSAPIRLLETRAAYQDPSAGQTKPARQLANGELFDLPITGQVMNGISVPAGAKAVIGNVTVTNTAASGYLTLFPFGATAPTASSINYAAGATVANGVIVGLSASGHLAIKVAGTTDVLFDAAGYIM